MTKSVVETVYKQLAEALGKSEAAAALAQLEPVFLALARNDRHIAENAAVIQKAKAARKQRKAIAKQAKMTRADKSRTGYSNGFTHPGGDWSWTPGIRPLGER